MRGSLSSFLPVRAACFAWICGLVPAGAGAVEIVAHRGASHDAPENTLPAVELAWKRGADAVEIDIHQTRDGAVVAIHDEDTERVTGQAFAVAGTALDQLRLLDAGSWRGERFQGTIIPTLAEVLATVPSGKSLVIEIKCPKSVLPALERILDESGKRASAILIAFDYQTISDAKRKMPDRPCYWLYGFSEQEAARYGVRVAADLLDRVARAGLDGLDLDHRGPWLQELVGALREVGKRTYVYTVNNPGAARRLVDLGVAGITTDRPAFLREALAVP